MLQPFTHANQAYFLHSDLPALKSIQKYASSQQTCALQNRACTSLCELSATICHQPQTERDPQQIPSPHKFKPEFSPWKVKKKAEVPDLEEVRIKRRKKGRKYSQCSRCETENKENQEASKQYMQNISQKKKSNSIFFKIMGLNEVKGTVNLKSEHPDIEMIACVGKKKSIDMENSKSQCSSSMERENSVPPQLNRQLTPKIVNLLQPQKGQYPKMSNKKVETSMIQEQSHRIFEPIFGEHWKGKHRNQKNKVQKKLPKESKSIEAREVRENCLKKRKGSISGEKAKKEEYRCTNPLTRLLYKKYLYTIGVSQDKPDHFL